MNFFLQQLANGLAAGSIYALIAVGYSVIYGALQMVNFAHGNIYMFGTFMFMAVTTATKNIFLGVLVGVVCSGALAMAVERFAYRPVRKANYLVPMISAFGAALIIQNICQLLFSTRTFPFPASVPNLFIDIGSIRISVYQLAIFVVALIIMLVITFLLKRTRLGQAVNCVSQNKVSSELMGINVNSIISLIYCAGAVVGVVGGMFFALYYNSIFIGMGFLGTMKGWIAAVVGGIGNIKGTFIAGIILGLVEAFGSAFISSAYRDVISYAVVIIVLIWKPNGLFGSQIAEKA
ncbi:MAG: branched-chain amino acid ABC transporter permease [Clostridiales bacterium]|nr:branched-chain amino acid ABC transporter permease [Clostridiales bacterium]